MDLINRKYAIIVVKKYITQEAWYPKEVSAITPDKNGPIEVPRIKNIFTKPKITE